MQSLGRKRTKNAGCQVTHYLNFPVLPYPVGWAGHTTKPVGKHPTHVTGTNGATGGGTAGAGTHGPGPGPAAGAGLRRPTVAVIVEFTNTNVVVTEDTTNWFLLIKNLFSLE
jgi:hypothetical protein